MHYLWENVLSSSSPKQNTPAALSFVRFCHKTCDQRYRTLSLFCMTLLIRVQYKLRLGMERSLPSPIFAGFKSMWLWFNFKMKDPLRVLSTIPIQKFCCRLVYQQKRHCRRLVMGFRTLTTGARQRWLLLWKSIKVSFLYFFPYPL